MLPISLEMHEPSLLFWRQRQNKRNSWIMDKYIQQLKTLGVQISVKLAWTLNWKILLYITKGKQINKTHKTLWMHSFIKGRKFISLLSLAKHLHQCQLSVLEVEDSLYSPFFWKDNSSTLGSQKLFSEIKQFSTCSSFILTMNIYLILTHLL